MYMHERFIEGLMLTFIMDENSLTYTQNRFQPICIVKFVTLIKYKKTHKQYTLSGYS